MITTKMTGGQKYGVTIDPGEFASSRNPRIFLNGTSITVTGQIQTSSSLLPSTEIAMNSQDGDNDSGTFLPVAFTQVLPSHSASNLSHAMVEGTTFVSDGIPSILQTNSGFRFLGGKVVVEHRGKPLSINVRKETFCLRGNVIAELVCTPSTISITNLTDRVRNSLIIQAANGAQLSLAPGERLVFGDAVDESPKRYDCNVNSSFGIGTKVSEVSLPFLLSRDSLLRDSTIYKRVIRTAACLESIRGLQGAPFKNAK